MSHALHEVIGVGGKRLAHDLGIGQGEVRRRQRARDLPEIQIRFPARELVQPLCLQKHILGPLRSEQIGLLPEVEIGVFRPLWVLEAVVGGFRLDERLDCLAQEAPH
jgi:hypothetical protein